MFEERWPEAAEAYKRYCDLETDVSNKIISYNLQLYIIMYCYAYHHKFYHITAAE